jgi:ABC-type antimicrobial peptide transport system permease subunit
MVVVVNDALTRQLFPGEEPVGRDVTSMGTSRRIVGVVKDVYEFGPGRASEPAAYIPYAQVPDEEWLRRSVTLLVRSAGDPAAITPGVREAIRAIDPRIPINDVQPMTAVLSANIAAPRFRFLVFGLFALLALTLTSVGIGGLMAFTLSQRRREIAIRLAVGAAPAGVTRLILWQGIRLTAAGVLVGLAASLPASRLLSALLFDVDPHDPSILVGVTGVLAAVGFVATWLPARRASRMSPASVLRSD